MKSIKNIISAAALLTAAVAPCSAYASVINFSGVNANMGTVSDGQSGTISGNLGTSSNQGFTFGSGSDYGFLPPDSEITITYNFSQLLAGGLTSYGSYNFTSNNLTYSGNNISSTTGGTSNPVSTTNGASSALLIFSSADLNPSETAGTVQIVNLSKGLAQFQSAISGVFGFGHSISVSYQVSAVPLPASLPMFAVAVAGLLGLAVARKRGMI